MIYYDIQHHGNTEQLAYLGHLLEHEDNILNISLDIEQKDFQKIKNQNIYKDWGVKFKALNIEHSNSLTWGGPSITQQMYKSLITAMKHNDWEYYINLSGTCVPLKSQKEIHSFLGKNWIDNGIRDYCYSFEPVRARHWYTTS